MATDNMEIPTVQILEKKDYFRQTLLPLPNAVPYAALGPSSIRIRTTVLSLSINNFTYAALGSMLGWWDVHPLPHATPAPYNDAKRYGRISAWGYADVLESTVPDLVPAGSQLYGYVPLGTLAEDLEVRALDDDNTSGNGSGGGKQILVTSPHRQHVMPIYNLYFAFPDSNAPAPASALARRDPAVAYEALLRVMHPTAFLLNHFVFVTDKSRVVAPAPGPDDVNIASDQANAPWSPARDADLSDATVLVFAPGAKVAVTFVTMLRARMESEGRPRRVIGASSEASSVFVKGTDVYDAVVSTGAVDPLAAVRDNESKGQERLVIIDFGGRAGVARQWAGALAAHYPGLLFVGVGSAVLEPATASAAFAAAGKPVPYRVVRVNADDMRRRAIKRVGREAYWAEEARSWERFRHEGIKGLEVTWGEGMDDVVKGWDRLARGEVSPSEGLVYKL